MLQADINIDDVEWFFCSSELIVDVRIGRIHDVHEVRCRVVSNAERRRQLLLNAVDVDLSYQPDESVVHANRDLSELTVEVS